MPDILIVDDESANRKTLEEYLKGDHPEWDLKLVPHEVDAIRLINEHEFDIVITDLDIDHNEKAGMNVLDAVRSKSSLTKAILITAKPGKLNRLDAFRLGAFDCVSRNDPAIASAAEEIKLKTETALAFREQTLQLLNNERRLTALKRHIDPNVLLSLPDNFEVPPLRSRIVTVCFWDIREFSRLSEILQGWPELISDFLKDYFAEAQDAIFAVNGVLDKFIGDGVMALFGALNDPTDDGDQDASNAIGAALDLKRRFDVLLTRWDKTWQRAVPLASSINIGLGCGINTGKVLVGNAGTASRDQFTALGSDVNLAQRLESRARGGQILISGTTAIRVIEEFILEEVTISGLKHMEGDYIASSVIGRR